MFMMHLPGVDIAVQRKPQCCRGKAYIPELACLDGGLRWLASAAAVWACQHFEEVPIRSFEIHATPAITVVASRCHCLLPISR
jgi:hypothetical protein